MLTRQPHRDLPDEAVASIGAVILGVMGKADTPREPAVIAALELLESGEISTETWAALTKGDQDLARAPAGMRGTREQRVRYAEMLLERTEAVTASRQFALGYILSLFDNGATINTHLLPPTSRGPSILLWYGFVSGLHPKSRIEDVGGGLGRRIVRDLLHRDGPLDPPRCDIGISELSILLGGGRQVEEIRAGYVAALNVELAPRVSTFVRWPQRPRDAEAAGAVPAVHPVRQADGQRALFEGSGQGSLLLELNDTIEHARHLMHRLGASSSPPLKKRVDRRRK
jgi:hypothetical protein